MDTEPCNCASGIGSNKAADIFAAIRAQNCDPEEVRARQLEAKVAELEIEAGDLEVRNEQLEARIAELECRNAELEAENAELFDKANPPGGV